MKPKSKKSKNNWSLRLKKNKRKNKKLYKKNINKNLIK